MIRFVARRVALALPLLLALSVATFAAMHAVPGGPLAVYEGDPALTADDINRLEERFGLAEPLPLRYLRWLSAITQGNWGYSPAMQQGVGAIIAARLPNTLLLMSLQLVVALAIAIPLGILSAVRPYSRFDNIATNLSLVGISVPTFWSGLLAISVFAVAFRELGLPSLPASGMAATSGPTDLADRIAHLVLPVSVLGLFHAAQYTRFIRASMLDVLAADYVRTARAKGLTQRLVLGRHAFPNAAAPLVTLLALDVPTFVSGAVVTESIFAWPGMGRLFLEAVTRSDYAIVMAIVMVTGALVLIGSTLADIAYGILDPRVRDA